MRYQTLRIGRSGLRIRLRNVFPFMRSGSQGRFFRCGEPLRSRLRFFGKRSIDFFAKQRIGMHGHAGAVRILQ